LIKKKRGLGRGLDALLGTGSKGESQQDSEPENISATKGLEPSAPQQDKDGTLRNVPIELIQPGVYQPRIDMHADALEELADSIKAQGVIQPIVIRPLKASKKTPSKEQKYEIIAGERRWRASQMAGLDNIPAVIREVTDKATIAMALIENIQREDLNPVEEANAIRRLINEFNMTHQTAAEAVGRSRTAVSNLLRLLELGNETKILLENGDLEMGHARALLALENDQQIEAAKQVISMELSVRDTEKLVKKFLAPKIIKAETKPDPDINNLENSLSEKLGAKVNFKHNTKGKGKMFIAYNSLDELEGILAHIK
jgi:ParB family transcriptional regulator, chromosome partitioning protein